MFGNDTIETVFIFNCEKIEMVGLPISISARFVQNSVKSVQ